MSEGKRINRRERRVRRDSQSFPPFSLCDFSAPSALSAVKSSFYNLVALLFLSLIFSVASVSVSYTHLTLPTSDLV